MERWEVHEWMAKDMEAFLAEIASMKARHRTNGCEVFDSVTARCTCPEQVV